MQSDLKALLDRRADAMCELVAEWDTQMRGIRPARFIPTSWEPSESEVEAARRYASPGSWDSQARVIGDVPHTRQTKNSQNEASRRDDVEDDIDDDETPYEGEEDDAAVVEGVEIELMTYGYRDDDRAEDDDASPSTNEVSPPSLPAGVQSLTAAFRGLNMLNTSTFRRVVPRNSSTGSAPPRK